MPGRPTMPEMPKTDLVLQWLMAINLTDREPDFRAILENIAEDPTNPETRDLVIATTATLMMLGGISWPIVIRAMTHLRRLPENELQEGAVAIVNGDYLVLPTADGGVVKLDLETLREVDGDMAPAFVSSIYSLTSVWEQVQKVL